MSDIGQHPDAIKARKNLSSLSAAIYAALEHGIEVAREYFGDRALDPWLFPHIVRFEVGERLQAAPGDFQSTKNPMSGIEILSHGYEIRVFKKSGSDESALYPPGNSQGRQDFYNQQLVIPGTGHLLSAPQECPNLAYVWEPQPDGLELYLVCPDGFDGIWKPGKQRWQIDIPHPALSLEPDQAFADEDDDLPIELEETGSEPGPDDAV